MSNRGITNLTLFYLQIFALNQSASTELMAWVQVQEKSRQSSMDTRSNSSISFLTSPIPPTLIHYWAPNDHLVINYYHWLLISYPSLVTNVLGQEINQSERQYVLGNLTTSYSSLWSIVPLWRDQARTLWFMCPWISRREFKVELSWAYPYTLSRSLI